jgi:chromosome partitioning protein
MKISVINQKGGSGKTSFAVLLVMSLASKWKKILAVDNDPQGGLTSSFNVKNDYGIFGILIGGDFRVKTVKRDSLTFDIIPADYRLVFFLGIFTGLI